MTRESSDGIIIVVPSHVNKTQNRICGVVLVAAFGWPFPVPFPSAGSQEKQVDPIQVSVRFTRHSSFLILNYAVTFSVSSSAAGSSGHVLRTPQSKRPVGSSTVALTINLETAPQTDVEEQSESSPIAEKSTPSVEPALFPGVKLLLTHESEDDVVFVVNWKENESNNPQRWPLARKWMATVTCCVIGIAMTLLTIYRRSSAKCIRPILWRRPWVDDHWDFSHRYRRGLTVCWTFLRDIRPECNYLTSWPKAFRF